MRRFHLTVSVLCLAAATLSSTRAMAQPSIVVSVPDQTLALVEGGVVREKFPVSTSKFGLGDNPGSYATPLGSMEIASKIGANAPLGAVFKSRKLTGEILRAERARPRSDRDPDPVAARSGAGQCAGLFAQHLHPWHAGGKTHRAAGQLRLHPDAFPRRGASLRCSQCPHKSRRPEYRPEPCGRASHGRLADARTKSGEVKQPNLVSALVAALSRRVGDWDSDSLVVESRASARSRLGKAGARQNIL